jgi:ribosomal protein S18 acetylase RimI-like enzyme
MLAYGIAETKRLGFSKMYLSTDHIGYYEKYGFAYAGQCYGLGGGSGRIYEIDAADGEKTNCPHTTQAEQLISAIEPISDSTRHLATAYIINEWYTAQTMIRGEIIDCTEIDGYILTDKARENILGLITYVFRDDACEIVTLNSERPGIGLGTALVEKAKAAAVAHGSKNLRLLTSNDNLNAIGFYQKRGFDLVGVNIGAIDRERETSSPEIPLLGQNGIPFRHELDFSMRLE